MNRSIIARMELVGACRWELWTPKFRLTIFGEGADLSENFHAELRFPDRTVYEGDGDWLEEAVVDLIFRMPEKDVDKLKVLMQESAPS